MSAAGIYVDIQGEPVDLSQVSWYEKAPCGCVSGVHVAYSNYGQGAPMVIATPEQAASNFWENKQIREKYEGLGFALFADLTSRCKELLVIHCPHEPRFGVPQRPEVEGYEWAAVHDAFSRPKLMHLAPSAAIEAARERRYASLGGSPLCGAKSAAWWSTEWYALDGKVECKRCWSKAAAR